MSSCRARIHLMVSSEAIKGVKALTDDHDGEMSTSLIDNFMPL